MLSKFLSVEIQARLLSGAKFALLKRRVNPADDGKPRRRAGGVV